jgi:ATP-dependent RNA helicase DDX3X
VHCARAPPRARLHTLSISLPPPTHSPQPDHTVTFSQAFPDGGGDARGYGGGGGGGGRNFGGSFGGRGGGGGGGYGRGRKNDLGFSGDFAENVRLETELYTKATGTSSGINFAKYDDIPVETSGEEVPPPCLEFTIEELGQPLINNTVRTGYTRPTPVQKYSIPIGLRRRDLMACAQTGSGKTAGFLFPVIAQMLRNGAAPVPDGTPSRCVTPNCLILAPTRELVTQIFDEARKFTYRTGIRASVVYGGADIKEQLMDLDRGCDLLVVRSIPPQPLAKRTLARGVRK